jgi:glycosyltransferase involved in cell wall biosynthesis
MAALERFPSAPVYTLIYNRASFEGTPLAGRDIRVAWVDRLPAASSYYRNYLPILPFAIRQLDLRSYEVVVSFHYAVAHGIQPRPGQTHLSYVYTPLRYAWRESGPYLPRFAPARWAAAAILGGIRGWDRRVSRCVRSYAAVSSWAAGNVRRAFGRSANVIYPPVDVERFAALEERDGYFLTVSRLVAHKRVDLVVDAFSRLGLPLVVVGDGPQRAALQRSAAANVRFLGYRPDAEVADLMGRARAFVHAGEEDFGIALVEAQAAGCPVIAFAGGAVSETITDGVHGLLFAEQSADGLVEAVTRFEREGRCFDRAELRRNAARFRTERFQDEFSRWVDAMGG